MISCCMPGGGQPRRRPDVPGRDRVKAMTTRVQLNPRLQCRGRLERDQQARVSPHLAAQLATPSGTEQSINKG